MSVQPTHCTLDVDPVGGTAGRVCLSVLGKQYESEFRWSRGRRERVVCSVSTLTVLMHLSFKSWRKRRPLLSHPSNHAGFCLTHAAFAGELSLHSCKVIPVAMKSLSFGFHHCILILGCLHFPFILSNTVLGWRTFCVLNPPHPAYREIAGLVSTVSFAVWIV